MTKTETFLLLVIFHLPQMELLLLILLQNIFLKHLVLTKYFHMKTLFQQMNFTKNMALKLPLLLMLQEIMIHLEMDLSTETLSLRWTIMIKSQEI